MQVTLGLENTLGSKHVKRGYSYDDLLLIPQNSMLDSRAVVDTNTILDQWIQLEVPIISSPMDSITNGAFALWMAQRGGMGIIHRYQTAEEQAKEVRWWHEQANVKYNLGGAKVGASIGASEEHELRADILFKAKPDCIAVDIAHGDTRRGCEIIEYIRKKAPGMVIISGNISGPDGARRVASAGADILRVGIGAGSVCTTRLVAGVGVPQLTAIASIHEAWGGYPIIADGGIRSSGDIVKALAAGASACMVGSLLSNYAETPGPNYRGMASGAALRAYKGSDETFTVEGDSRKKSRKTPEETEALWSQLVGGIRQGFAYLGAQNIEELQARAEWVEVTGRGYLEGTAHGVS